MSNFPSNSNRNSTNGSRPRSLRDSMNLGKSAAPRPAPLPLDDDDNWGNEPEESLEQTSLEEKQHILNSLREDGTDTEELDKLQGENDQLRGIIVELRDQLEQATGQSHEVWEEREREFEAMLEEKSEKIRELYLRLQEVEQAGPPAGTAPHSNGEGDADMPSDQELAALSDDLERERCALEQEHRTLEDDRRQLREDEEAMMRQMREMEMQMAKERAELARQRNELQRLHSEIRHELELAQRDAAVNERLRILQRRNQNADDETPTPRGKGSSGEVPAAPKKKSSTPGVSPKGKSSQGSGGLFGRFFNRDK